MIIGYGDTDSFFASEIEDDQFAEFVDRCTGELYPKLLAEYGCKENFIKLAYEKKFSRIVFLAAKRYIGSYAHYKGKAANSNSKPEIKGVEYMRGDVAKLARDLQASVIDLLVGGLDVVDRPKPSDRCEDFVEIIEAAKAHILVDPLSIDEVKLSRAITKAMREYVAKTKTDGTSAALPAHVVIAKIMIQRGEEVGKGTRVDYVVSDGSTSPSRVIPAADYTGENVDRYYLWDDLVWPASRRLLVSAFPTFDWSRWDRTRPAKPRGRRDRVLPGQVALPDAPLMAVAQRIDLPPAITAPRRRSDSFPAAE